MMEIICNEHELISTNVDVKIFLTVIFFRGNSMKEKSWWKVYLITLITLGIYSLYWVLDTMGQINHLYGKAYFNIKRRVILLGVLLMGYILDFIGLIFYVVDGLDEPTSMTAGILASFIIAAILTTIWVVILIIYIIQIARAIANIQEQLKIAPKIEVVLSGILFILWWSAIPYIQENLNKIIYISNNQKQ